MLSYQPVHAGLVGPLLGKLWKNLEVSRRRNPPDGRMSREKRVVEPPPSSQPLPLPAEGHTRDEHASHRRGLDSGQIAAGLKKLGQPRVRDPVRLGLVLDPVPDHHLLKRIKVRDARISQYNPCCSNLGKGSWKGPLPRQRPVPAPDLSGNRRNRRSKEFNKGVIEGLLDSRPFSRFERFSTTLDARAQGGRCQHDQSVAGRVRPWARSIACRASARRALIFDR